MVEALNLDIVLTPAELALKNVVCRESRVSDADFHLHLFFASEGPRMAKK
jgi:hypothetical protein